VIFFIVTSENLLRRLYLTSNKREFKPCCNACSEKENPSGVERSGVDAEPGPAEGISELLAAWGEGDRAALDYLVVLVDAELRRIARSYLDKEQPDAILQTTVIINEVYLRLLGGTSVSCRNRSHFYAICAQIMRRILVDHARARKTAKRGAGAVHVSLEQSNLLSQEQFTDVIAIDEALASLAQVDARKSKVVELRFFGGLSVEETAQALNISPESVLRDWRLAKLWLLRHLKGEKPDEG
jgi:RNA polymerase sigma factor (TIGR02999 family)